MRHAFAHGDALRSFVVAVVVPNEAALAKRCEAEGGGGGTDGGGGSDVVRERVVLRELAARAAEAGLLSYEVPQAASDFPEM